MHIISGGTYKGEDFSCMYDANDRYTDTSKNGNFFFQLGINDSKNNHPAILIFSVETGHLVYAENIDNADDFEYAMEKLTSEMTFLTEETDVVILYKEVKPNESMMNISQENEEKTPLSSTEMYELEFGTKIRVVWHNSKHHPKGETFYGVVFGGNIGYTDGLFDEIGAIAECAYNDWCKVYIED